eukprot:scaffold238_cov111-Isochrysis_galbana.AAC.8
MGLASQSISPVSVPLVYLKVLQRNGPRFPVSLPGQCAVGLFQGAASGMGVRVCVCGVCVCLHVWTRARNGAACVAVSKFTRGKEMGVRVCVLCVPG